mgnify:FL=1|jgi:hypothetical protein
MNDEKEATLIQLVKVKADHTLHYYDTKQEKLFRSNLHELKRSILDLYKYWLKD